MPARSEAELAAIPGVVENGLFTRCVTDLLVGAAGGVRQPAPRRLMGAATAVAAAAARWRRRGP